jgi:triosephosphate isomerase
MRRKIIAGNWKMNMDLQSGPLLAEAIHAGLQSIALPEDVDVVLCPPFILLPVIQRQLGPRLRLGAQTMHNKPSGAYTGEISAAMLLSAGCTHVILGHSERRMYFAESDFEVKNRVNAAVDAHLVPIICVGETIGEREAGDLEKVITRQVRAALDGIFEEGARRSIIAYEPIWAIGTGHTATPEQAQEVHHLIRSTIARIYSDDVATSFPILYGGSVKGSNAAELFAQPDIDGALVGGASLEAADFVAIVKASRPV